MQAALESSSRATLATRASSCADSRDMCSLRVKSQLRGREASRALGRFIPCCDDRPRADEIRDADNSFVANRSEGKSGQVFARLDLCSSFEYC